MTSARISLEVHDFGPANFDWASRCFDGTRLVEQRHRQRRRRLGGGRQDASRSRPKRRSATPTSRARSVGSESELIQEQTFVKRGGGRDADVHDAAGTHRDARRERRASAATARKTSSSATPSRALLSYEIEAYRTDLPGEIQTFFSVGGTMIVRGFAEHWKSSPSTALGSRLPFWNEQRLRLHHRGPQRHVGFARGADAARAAHLRSRPLIDRSRQAVPGSHRGHAQRAYNRLAGPPSERPTSAGAYMNFEAPSTGGGGGAMFESSGLEQVETLSPPPDPPPPIVPPPPCVPGPGAGGHAAVHAAYVRDSRDGLVRRP